MNPDQKVTAEPAGDTEADWSTRAKSTLDLPRFETGEFDSLAEAAESVKELTVHMSALIGEEAEEADDRNAAPKAEEEEISGEADEVAEEDGPGLLRRTGGQVVSKLTGR